MHQRRPQTLQQLETYSRQEWEQIPTSKLQKLITSMPRCQFKLFWKEEEMQHHGKHAPIPTIVRPVAGIKFEIRSFCAKIVKFLSLNICYVIYVLLWIKYWLKWFESLLVLILFKLKKYPNISGIQVVHYASIYLPFVTLYSFKRIILRTGCT